MQLDMHYYGTYAMARAAGLTLEAARMIANCAQFVDDNVAQVDVEFRDGARIDAEATAHHAVDVENLEAHDQRRVWVPFHFLPGNQGEGYTERLKCRTDSEIARDMRYHHLELADQPYALALMGVAAHVYADTFSHYGFSGVSSRGNKIINDSFKFDENLDPEIRDYITGKAERFFKAERGGGALANIKSWLAEKVSDGLGHGAVATYPDRPYLAWSFEYEKDDGVEGKRSDRNNQETFLAGCRALHGMFRQFAGLGAKKFRGDDARDFDEIETRVAQVLATQGKKQDRIEAWQRAAREGTVFGAGGEQIPAYEGAGWNERWKAMNDSDASHAAMAEPVWRFYQAASLHRIYVLRELLPAHGLIVN